MSDLRQAPKYGDWMRSIGWQVDEGAFIKKLLGVSFIKIQRQKRPKIKFNNPGIKIIKIEPAWEDKTDYKALGFKPDKSPMLPSKTIWLNLKKSEKQLLKKVHYKTRYNIKKNSAEISVKRGDKLTDKQLKKFYIIYKQNCRKQKFWGLNLKQLKSLFRCFGKKAWLLTTNLGGLVILIHDKTTYYSHNGATQEGKRKFVPTILTWEAIKLTKKLGCSRFDFEGISDERFPITKKWRGFTRFKKSFGGKEIEYRGSFSKYFL